MNRLAEAATGYPPVFTTEAAHMITKWNDHPDRTKAEVLAAYGKAIEQEAKKCNS